MSERTSEQPSIYVSILGCSEPQCAVIKSDAAAIKSGATAMKRGAMCDEE